MARQSSWYQKQYFQETIFFIAMFFLTMLHEWMDLDTLTGFVKGLVFFLIIYAQAQIHRFLIFPWFLQKKYVIYITLSIGITLTGAALLFTANYYWIDPWFYQKEGLLVSLVYHLVICVVGSILILSLFLVKKYSLELQRRDRDRLILNEMNLKFLHAQLNPHFFFNMLNNLYGVSLAEPKRVPDLILKLSNLMRYQLENGKKTTTAIGEDIKFISDYIDMEKERIGKRCQITFSVSLPEEKYNRYQIAPLVLITLVENAFKHSVTINSRWFVNISISIEEYCFQICVINSLADKNLQKESTGIGLDNVRERLELLYRGRYQFTAGEYDSEYRTCLRLQLNEI